MKTELLIIIVLLASIELKLTYMVRRIMKKKFETRVNELKANQDAAVEAYLERGYDDPFTGDE